MRLHRRGPRRRIGVPKGMLRYISMQLMEQQPMSGSELMDQIQGYTDWRPSPGSMYPLLARLEEERLIEQLEDEDPTLKRFAVTDTGLKELEGLKHFDAQFRSRNISMKKIYWRLHLGMPEDIYDSLSLLLDRIEENYERVAHDPDKTSLLKDILEDAAERIAEI